MKDKKKVSIEGTKPNYHNKMTRPEIPKAWGWYYPIPSLAESLRLQLRQVLSDDDFISSELIAYNQNRDHALLRRDNVSDNFIVVSLKRNRQNASPVDFAGTFSAFTAREQKRYDIEQRMIEQANRTLGICLVCFSNVNGLCSGIWNGSPNGPLYSAVCKSCGSFLNAFPTHQEADAGIFLWWFEEWALNFPPV